jgi:hypothetical protein
MPTYDLATESEQSLVKLCEEKHQLSVKADHKSRMDAIAAQANTAFTEANTAQQATLSQLVADGGGGAPGAAITIVKDEAGAPTQLSW